MFILWRRVLTIALPTALYATMPNPDSADNDPIYKTVLKVSHGLAIMLLVV